MTGDTLEGEGGGGGVGENAERDGPVAGQVGAARPLKREHSNLVLMVEIHRKKGIHYNHTYLLLGGQGRTQDFLKRGGGRKISMYKVASRVRKINFT